MFLYVYHVVSYINELLFFLEHKLVGTSNTRNIVRPQSIQFI